MLAADAKNVAVVHCLTGKGRTATVLACLLASAHGASVRRAFLNGEASQVKVDYECPGHSECPEAGLPCDFADGALLSNQFLGDKQVRFEGPGFGNPNGGVWLGGCRS